METADLRRQLSDSRRGERRERVDVRVYLPHRGAERLEPTGAGGGEEDRIEGFVRPFSKVRTCETIACRRGAWRGGARRRLRRSALARDARAAVEGLGPHPPPRPANESPDHAASAACSGVREPIVTLS
jgi:hypothetical protein